MKKTLLIIGGIGLVLVLLLARLLTVEHNGRIEETEWFARELRYEFSAEVDSIRMYNEHAGRLWCRLTAGNPQVHREDSLKKSFKNHTKLYLVFQRSADSITFILPNANLLSKGDSIRVSSSENTIRLFRAGKQLANESLSSSLTAHGRPIYRMGK